MQTYIAEPLLPAEGIDLRAELATHIRVRIKQALECSGGGAADAAKLLRLTQLELLRMQKCATVTPVVAHQPAASPETDPSEGRREAVSRAAIRRLAGAGFSARQIADHFHVPELFVTKVLRAEAELAKCGPLPAHNEEQEA